MPESAAREGHRCSSNSVSRMTAPTDPQPTNGSHWRHERCGAHAVEEANTRGSRFLADVSRVVERFARSNAAARRTRPPDGATFGDQRDVARCDEASRGRRTLCRPIARDEGGVTVVGRADGTRTDARGSAATRSDRCRPQRRPAGLPVPQSLVRPAGRSGHRCRSACPLRGARRIDVRVLGISSARCGARLRCGRPRL